ncbi:major capsid protein [Bacteroides thetaiotaomicron]|uniref:major capsid protein n=1 Tax=Bacteroides thetaiotaomicron TaxID=818 RepID=UPI003567CA39
MNKSLMIGITEKDMQAVINTYDLKPYYYPTLFPLKENYTLSWKALEAQIGLRIAGDLVARGASISKKTREAIARIQGDIPKIAIKRTKDENELNEYDIMVAMTSANPDLRALVEAWAEDTNFCWDGVAARLEWMALQTISLGKITLLNDNNSSVVKEYDVDYQLEAWQKVGFQTGSASWLTSASAKPISKDFKAIVKAAKAKGISLKFAFMNLDTFATFAETEEVIKLCASFANNALQLSQSPSVEQVNNTLRTLPYLRGLQIVIIDQDITIELPNGDRKTGNPFVDNVVMFSESKVLGATYWKKPADMALKGSAAIKAMNGHTCIKKYSNEEPIEEVTVGIANAFPAWLASGRSFLMATNSNAWNH